MEPGKKRSFYKDKNTSTGRTAIKKKGNDKEKVSSKGQITLKEGRTYKNQSASKNKTAIRNSSDNKEREHLKQQQDVTEKKNSRCPYSMKCGGCQMVDIPYEMQLKKKEEVLRSLLGSFGKLEPIIGMEHPDHYRNKVHAVFGIDRRKKPIAGVYEAKSHRVVDVEKCFLENEKSTEIIRTIKGLLKSFKIKTYDEDSGYGLLRHVLIRTARETGQIMVVLILASPILPSKNNFVKALRKEHPEITTVVINVNDRSTSMVLGEKEQVIYGKGYIEDILCGKRFKISPKSFYQINPVQTTKLYQTAIDYAALTGKETVLDAYCGIGTIGMIASDFAKRVIGVELNNEAVKDARTNAKINDIKNIEFYHKDAGQFMIQLAEQQERIDVVFMDPPRAGSDENFLKSVVICSPERIVYVSCNPETLARDLKYLTKNGYVVKRMRGCDMFCHTEHVESVCLLSKVQK